MRVGTRARPEINMDGIIRDDACKLFFDTCDLLGDFLQSMLYFGRNEKTVSSFLHC